MHSQSPGAAVVVVLVVVVVVVVIDGLQSIVVVDVVGPPVVVVVVLVVVEVSAHVLLSGVHTLPSLEIQVQRPSHFVSTTGDKVVVVVVPSSPTS
jgi:hypothetical protein